MMLFAFRRSARLFARSAVVFGGALVATAPLLAQNAGATAPATRQVVTAPSVAGVAAEVNGEKIQLTDLNRLVESIRKSEPAFATGTPAAQKALEEVKVQMLDEMINTRLLVQEAKRQRISADPARVEQEVAAFKKAFKDEAAFNDWLKADGQSLTELKQTITDDLLIQELTNRLAADVTVSDDEIRAYYRANLNQFTVREGVVARHILLAVNPSAPQSEKARVQKRAADLAKTIKTATDFANAAKTQSDDAATRNRGGLIGSFTLGVLDPAFEKAAFAAPVGKIAGPVATDAGYHLIWVDKKLPKKTAPVEQVVASRNVRAQLLKEKMQNKIDTALSELRAKSKINKFV